MTSKLTYRTNGSNFKRVLVLVAVAVYVGAMGWLVWHYNATAPERTASALLNDISQKSDYTSAYKLTASTYKANVSSTSFSSYFGPLAGSKTHYTVLKQIVTGKNAVVNGVVVDLNGINYVYAMHLTKTGGGWLVDAINANQQ